MEDFDVTRFSTEAILLARYEALLAATGCFTQAMLRRLPRETAEHVKDDFVQLMTEKTESWVKKAGGESPGDELSPTSELIVRTFSVVADALIPGSVFEND